MPLRIRFVQGGGGVCETGETRGNRRNETLSVSKCASLCHETAKKLFQKWPISLEFPGISIQRPIFETVSKHLAAVGVNVLVGGGGCDPPFPPFATREGGSHPP